MPPELADDIDVTSHDTESSEAEATVLPESVQRELDAKLREYKEAFESFNSGRERMGMNENLKKRAVEILAMVREYRHLVGDIGVGRTKQQIIKFANTLKIDPLSDVERFVLEKLPGLVRARETRVMSPEQQRIHVAYIRLLRKANRDQDIENHLKQSDMRPTYRGLLEKRHSDVLTAELVPDLFAEAQTALSPQVAATQAVTAEHVATVVPQVVRGEEGAGAPAVSDVHDYHTSAVTESASGHPRLPLTDLIAASRELAQALLQPGLSPEAIRSLQTLSHSYAAAMQSLTSAARPTSLQSSPVSMGDEVMVYEAPNGGRVTISGKAQGMVVVLGSDPSAQ